MREMWLHPHIPKSQHMGFRCNEPVSVTLMTMVSEFRQGRNPDTRLFARAGVEMRLKRLVHKCQLYRAISNLFG